MLCRESWKLKALLQPSVWQSDVQIRTFLLCKMVSLHPAFSVPSEHRLSTNPPSTKNTKKYSNKNCNCFETTCQGCNNTPTFAIVSLKDFFQILLIDESCFKKTKIKMLLNAMNAIKFLFPFACCIFTATCIIIQPVSSIHEEIRTAKITLNVLKVRAKFGT